MSVSSRDSATGAGWHGQEPGQFESLMPERVKKLSWLNPATLWSARNGPLASLFGDPTNEERQRWVARQRDRGVPADFVIERDDPETYSFMLIADTGEGDAPQYAVVPGLLEAGEGSRFAVLSSDVIYPVGSADDYGPKFFRPYRDYNAPIYAIPGNHDWYDGLTGFMRVFCEALALPAAARPKVLSAGWWRTLLWKSPAAADEQRLAEARSLRSAPAQQSEQPGPYWAIDSGPLRIIGIDTGLLGGIDKEQGEWLRRVSQGPRPKILVTGSPIYVDDKYHPCAIEGGGTVDEIVRDADCHFVAAIGGDIHNYQHYPVDVDGRTIEYVVSGGGGAFMHATHIIPRVTVAGVTEQDFRCYPLRGDSLAFYSGLYGRRLRMKRFFALTSEQASAVIAKRLGIPPTRTTTAAVTLRTRLVASLLGVPSRPHGRSWFRLPVRKIYTQVLSPGSVTYTPPFFKSFLRLDVTPQDLRIRCFAATGYREQEVAPPVEDDFTIPLG
ncbi:metallophosphoesterase [Streptomyces sp. SID13666]|uniref:metallophosphoesterase n=1 Tax=unclassified Streptomyces TaxID=2593676 RepID=UPI0013C19881|nr:metallophosphoesterase [Streptomyces sp. SID13666]NEA71504.1 metallophosphoesterase [Streptomyces sp. SID13588]